MSWRWRKHTWAWYTCILVQNNGTVHMRMYACTTKFISVQRLWYFWKYCLFYLSDKHETGSEAEINHVHKNPLLCFWGCHKWNGEWMFLLCCVSHQNWKRFQFINCVAQVWGQFMFQRVFFVLFCHDLTQALYQLDFVSPIYTCTMYFWCLLAICTLPLTN